MTGSTVSPVIGAAVGGASYWGGADGLGANATTPGVGGYTSSTAYNGGSGLIAIMGG